MDFEFFGRSLVEFFVRTLVVSGVLFIGLLVGGLIGSLIRNQGMGVLIGFWLTSVTAIGMILPVMAWAFRRFDHGRP